MEIAFCIIIRKQRIRLRDCRYTLEVGGLILNITIYFKAVVVMVWYWHNNRPKSLQPGTKSPITGLHVCRHLIYDEDGAETVVISVNDAGLIGYSWGGMKSDHLFISYVNINFKRTVDLSVKGKEKYFHSLGRCRSS